MGHVKYWIYSKNQTATVTSNSEFKSIFLSLIQSSLSFKEPVLLLCLLVWKLESIKFGWDPLFILKFWPVPEAIKLSSEESDVNFIYIAFWVVRKNTKSFPPVICIFIIHAEVLPILTIIQCFLDSFDCIHSKKGFLCCTAGNFFGFCWQFIQNL